MLGTEVGSTGPNEPVSNPVLLIGVDDQTDRPLAWIGGDAVNFRHAAGLSAVDVVG